LALSDILEGEEMTCNYFQYDADTPWKLGLHQGTVALEPKRPVETK
jgi:hypothetical protein